MLTIPRRSREIPLVKLVASANFMRLSLKKPAYMDLVSFAK